MPVMHRKHVYHEVAMYVCIEALLDEDGDPTMSAMPGNQQDSTFTASNQH